MKVILSDERLIELSKEKGDKHYTTLFKRYKKFAISIINDVSNSLNQGHIEFDDCFYEFYQSFEKAMERFKSSKGLFYVFFKVIFRRRITAKMISFIKSNDALDHSISLNQDMEDGISLMDMIENDNADDPIASYKLNNAKLYLREKTAGRTCKRNIRYKALALRSEGLSYPEIAKKLRTTASKVRRMMSIVDDLQFQNVMLELK